MTDKQEHIIDDTIRHFWNTMMWSDEPADEVLLRLRDRIAEELADLYSSMEECENGMDDE